MHYRKMFMVNTLFCLFIIDTQTFQLSWATYNDVTGHIWPTGLKFDKCAQGEVKFKTIVYCLCVHVLKHLKHHIVLIPPIKLTITMLKLAPGGFITCSITFYSYDLKYGLGEQNTSPMCIWSKVSRTSHPLYSHTRSSVVGRCCKFSLLLFSFAKLTFSSQSTSPRGMRQIDNFR